MRHFSAFTRRRYKRSHYVVLNRLQGEPSATVVWCGCWCKCASGCRVGVRKFVSPRRASAVWALTWNVRPFCPQHRPECKCQPVCHLCMSPSPVWFRVVSQTTLDHRDMKRFGKKNHLRALLVGKKWMPALAQRLNLYFCLSLAIETLRRIYNVKDCRLL